MTRVRLLAYDDEYEILKVLGESLEAAAKMLVGFKLTYLSGTKVVSSLDHGVGDTEVEAHLVGPGFEGSEGARGKPEIDTATASKVEDLLAREQWDLVILDNYREATDEKRYGVEKLLPIVVSAKRRLPYVVIHTGKDQDPESTKAVYGRADLHVAWIVKNNLLPETLANLIRRVAPCSNEIESLSQPEHRDLSPTAPPTYGLLGRSSRMQLVLASIQNLADSPSSVLITGESGTGKELVARAIHAAGSRKEGPFVAMNCSAFPESLVESELFGYVRGAHNTADSARKGLCVFRSS